MLLPDHPTPFAAGYVDGLEGLDTEPVTAYHSPKSAVDAAQDYVRGFSAGGRDRERGCKKPLYTRRKRRAS